MNANELNHSVNPILPILMVSEWDKTFSKNEAVNHQKISFINRYEITLVGDLYMPKNMQSGGELPAITISGPFDTLKEQSSGFYAQEMVSRGL